MTKRLSVPVRWGKQAGPSSKDVLVVSSELFGSRIPFLAWVEAAEYGFLWTAFTETAVHSGTAPNKSAAKAAAERALGVEDE